MPHPSDPSDPTLPPGWRLRTVEVVGRPLHVRLGPPVPGSVPVVLLHGFALAGWSVLPTARLLSAGATVVVPDLPGHGESPPWGRALPVQELADALLGTLDALGLPTVDLLGTSMGCAVSLEVARLAPERVRRLVLTSPTGGPHNEPLLRAVGQLLRDGLHEPPRVLPRVVRDYLRFGPAGVVRLFAQTTRHPALERAEQEAHPTLVVVGTRDPLAPPASRLVRLGRQGPPHVAVAAVEGAAHGMCASHPDEVARLVAAWQSERDAPPAPPGASRTVRVPHD